MSMKKLRIKRITPMPRQDVYDISVDQYENYILGNGVITHNSGLKYAASQIIFLSKKKDKEGSDVVGNIIHCKNHKNRLTKENKMVDVRLSYDKGLDRYYGLLELAEKHGIITKISTRYEFPGGTKVFGKTAMEDPEKYFTQEVLERIRDAAAKEFKYGAVSVETDEE